MRFGARGRRGSWLLANGSFGVWASVIDAGGPVRARDLFGERFECSDDLVGRYVAGGGDIVGQIAARRQVGQAQLSNRGQRLEPNELGDDRGGILAAGIVVVGQDHDVAARERRPIGELGRGRTAARGGAHQSERRPASAAFSPSTTSTCGVGETRRACARGATSLSR